MLTSPYNSGSQLIVFTTILIHVKNKAAVGWGPESNSLNCHHFSQPVTSPLLPPLDLAPRPQSPAERMVRWGLVAALHGLVAYGLIQFTFQPETSQVLSSISVRLLPMQELKKPEPLPLPPPPATPVRKTPPPVLQPVLAAKAPEATAAFAVPPQPPAPVSAPAVAPAPAPAPVAAPAAPAPVTAARFDADYLHNPKPVYPPFSKRNGEEGKVLLRVKVGADGSALDLDIKQSSGFPRLDNAAREAVAKWRFVPAKRGDEVIESWVTVPITFALD